MKKIIFGLILIIIFVGLIISINSGINLSRLNSMYEDIDVLDDKIAIYYLNHGYIPVKDVVEFSNSTNPNDNDVYYEIDFEKLDSIYLNYGRKLNNENDYYIINELSHTIYYFDGIEYKNNKYYTTNVNYKLVELK